MAEAKKLTSGTIETDKIQATHEKIREIVAKYDEAKAEIGLITTNVKKIWVGKGADEFENQYNILVKKVEDFGDTLTDIYTALVTAQGEYDTTDDSTRQTFAMVTNKMQ